MLFILSRQINRKLTATVKKHKELGNLIEEVVNKSATMFRLLLMIIKSRIKSLVSFYLRLMRLRKEKKK